MLLNSDFVLDAVTTVLDWDLPEGSFSNAMSAQACHLAGPDADDGWGCEGWNCRTFH